MKSNRLKLLHERLDEKEPFTQRELNSMDKRDRAFIRDIQIVYKVPKDKALAIYNDKQLKKDSKGAIKRLGNKVRKKIKKWENSETSAGGSNKDNKHVTKFVPPSKEKGYKKPTKKSTKERVNKDVKDYLENPKSQKDKTYLRVKKGFSKHGNASLYELRHGYNSTASKRYRERHNPVVVKE